MQRRFSGTWSKFDDVTYLAFVVADLSQEGSFGFVQEFLHGDYVPVLFTPSQTVNGQCPIDKWTCFESLNLQEFTFGSPVLFFECLMEWVTQRWNRGKRKLHFRFMDERTTNNLI